MGETFQVFYPNLVKKQRLPKRDGNGQFTGTATGDAPRQDKTRVENSNKDIKQVERPEDNDNTPPHPAETLPAETGIDSNPDAVAFQFSENKNSPPKLTKADPSTPPVEVEGQIEFDNGVAWSIYDVVFAMHQKTAHAPEIESAKPETWGQHIKRLRIDDKRPEGEIRKVLAFAFRNKFWRYQIQSASGFRRMYPEILKQFEADERKKNFK